MIDYDFEKLILDSAFHAMDFIVSIIIISSQGDTNGMSVL